MQIPSIYLEKLLNGNKDKTKNILLNLEFALWQPEMLPSLAYFQLSPSVTGCIRHWQLYQVLPNYRQLISTEKASNFTQLQGITYSRFFLTEGHCLIVAQETPETGSIFFCCKYLTLLNYLPYIHTEEHASTGTGHESARRAIYSALI